MNNPSGKTKKSRVGKMASARMERQVISDSKYKAFVHVALDGQYNRFHDCHQRE